MSSAEAKPRQSEVLEYPEPGQVWKLELHRRDGQPNKDEPQPLIRFYTVQEVRGNRVLFAELRTASDHDYSWREHMATSDDWQRVGTPEVHHA